MRLLPLLAASLLAPASARYLTIANAASITRCLSVVDGGLVLEDCISNIGAEWNWTLSKAAEGGRLQAVGFVAAELHAGSEPQCLDENLRFLPCAHTGIEWTWDRRTLQLRMTSQGENWCLGLNGHELLLEHCRHLDGTPRGDQNGYGAPAEQTWVLLPTDRPQIRLLDRIQFPLRVSGRYIVDAEGGRVKLAGVHVNWIDADGSVPGLAAAPLKRTVQTIKYMGFNTVRVSLSGRFAEGGRAVELSDAVLQANPALGGKSALEVFDALVEEITSEGLLVVISWRPKKAGPCCSGTDGGELWYGEDYTEEAWLEGLTFVADRYKGNPRVVGFDLLEEPRLRESNETIPWWGAPRELNWLTDHLGYRFADWRVAASKGAVAVWRGQPDALVIVQGQMYATNLEDVVRRPMGFHQDCLASRVVYATHESRWSWPLADFQRDLLETLQPWSFYKDLRKVAREASDNGRSDRSGAGAEQGHGTDFSYVQGGPSVSYDEWAESRVGAAYYLHSRDLAPVWVSEFGTNQKEDNAWWDYLLKYFRESDISWCYASLEGATMHTTQGGERILETYGIFDAHASDYSRVVGWKLQDLIEIQAPALDQPEHVLDVGGECRFEYAANREAVQKPTGLFQLLTTTSYSPTEILALSICIVAILLVLLLPILCCCCCCSPCCRSNSAREEGVKAWPIKDQERSYLALNRDALETMLTATSQMTTMRAGTTTMAREGLVDAEPQPSPFQTHYPGVPGLPPRFPQADRGLFCCSSMKNSPRSYVRGVQ